jgi:hypothetical protein
MSLTGNIKEIKLYVDGAWSLYGRPSTWGLDNLMKSYFIHDCPNYKKSIWYHYWINYLGEEKQSTLFDIDCQECNTSAPQGLQALWRFHSFGCETALIFMEKTT